jgi:hypothetical protein
MCATSTAVNNACRQALTQEWDMRGKGNRRRPVLGLLLVAALASGSMFFGQMPTAHADSIVYEQVLYQVKDNPYTAYDERDVRVSNPADPTCTHIPGIMRGGKVWVDTYVSDTLGRYNGLKWSFWTTYRRAVATAKESFRYQYGKQASCAFLNTFDNKGELPALRQMTCQNPWANQSVMPTRWCQLESRLEQGLAVPSTVNVHTENCQQPQWNNGRWGGPTGWASWHNQHVKLDTTDILKEIGLDWIPGHFNIDTYAQDFDMLSASRTSIRRPCPTPMVGGWGTARCRRRTTPNCGCGSMTRLRGPRESTPSRTR